MSQPTTSSTPAPVKPARSPIERAIVWGVIAIGLLVVIFEAQAHFAHGAALQKLQSQITENETKDAFMIKKDVDKVVGSKTPESQKLQPLETPFSASRVDIYIYPGLLRQRKMFVYYGIAGRIKDQEAEVLAVLADPSETAAEAQSKQANQKPDPDAKTTQVPSGPGMGGPGASPGVPVLGGPGGMGARPAGRGARPAAEGQADKKDDAEKKPADKPAAEPTADADKKPTEEAKPDAAKPDDAKPAADKPAETEPKKE
jgi:hypothetical protein